MNRNDKKLATHQAAIRSLAAQNDALKEECNALKKDYQRLMEERNHSYAIAKQLIAELKALKKEYEDSLFAARQTRETCGTLLQTLKTQRDSYRKTMNSYLSTIKTIHKEELL